MSVQKIRYKYLATPNNYLPVFQAGNGRVILHHRQLVHLLTGGDETFLMMRHGFSIYSGEAGVPSEETSFGGGRRLQGVAVRRAAAGGEEKIHFDI